MNVLILDKTQPEIAEALKDCVVGETKDLTLSVLVKADDDQVFVGEVESVEYAAPAEAEEETPADGERPYTPKKKGAMAAEGMGRPAVTV